MITALSSLLLSLPLLASLVTSIPYSEYILAPGSRKIRPTSVHRINGTVESAASLTTSDGDATFHDVSAVTYDFGKNVAGMISIHIGQNSDSHQFVGVTFSESSLWISGVGSDATAYSGIDQILWFHVKEPCSYTVSKEHQRGGFRYLSVIHNTTGFVEVTGLSVEFTAMPHFPDDGLRNYTGYFHSEDDVLNRAWYAGAYTCQLCTIDPTTGDTLVHEANIDSTTHVTGTVDWYSNSTIANGSSVLVDGAKRDRLAFAGDMIIAMPTIFVSTHDLVTVKNTLESLLILQNASGMLPYVGRPYSKFGFFSYTYHLYALIGLHDYYKYSGDEEYLSLNWYRFKLGLNYTLSKIDSSKLMNVSTPDDWLRFGMGGHNIEANAILYYTINLGLKLANLLGDTSVVAPWQQYASGIKSAANTLLWDSTAGLYRDNETTALHPQDGNVWAVVSNLTTSHSQIASISTKLAARWTPHGAPALEAHDAISPFVSGLELQVHYIAGQPCRALDLIRLMWGFMLDDLRMTNSTLIEGYSSDGSLHYAPYANDPRVSHAHGWSSGPTSVLTFYAGGIMPTAAEGRTWVMKPSPGDLRTVTAGFKTGLGIFSADYAVLEEGWVYLFESPVGTSGSLSVEHPGCAGVLRLMEMNGASADILVQIKRRQRRTGEVADRIELDGLEGGSWKATLTCFEDSFAISQQIAFGEMAVGIRRA